LARKEKETKESHKKKGVITTWPMYVILVIIFILYIAYQNVATLATIFGSAAFFLIIVLLILEVINGSKHSGKLRNILEIIIAVVIVVAVWFSLKVILQTNYPIDAVPSCSMLPSLQRGDMIVIHGTNASHIKAPQVQVTKSAMQNLFNNISNESLECVAYQINGRTVNVSQEVMPGYSVGLFKSTINGGSIISYSQQANNLIKYQCGIADVKTQTGNIIKEAYTSSITISNTTITGDRNNSIIVYKTIPQDSFYKEGDSYIVHRVYAIINADGSYYYLTKGDNNPGLDLQYFNSPSNQSFIEGKVITTIPYIGYLKLILSGTLYPPAGCNTTFETGTTT
jgi:signal peptidase I